MDKKIPPGHKPTAASNDKPELTDISASAQRARLLEALRQGPLTTLQIRRNLNILMPAARVKELRDLGYRITTQWVNDHDEMGRAHYVAKYVLIQGAVA
jgi:hypothetical protein